ncbi:hypothetical protein Tco_0761208 [Tanacetum coccineum]
MPLLYYKPNDKYLTVILLAATDLPATLSVSSIGQLDQATNFSPKSLEMSTPPTEEEINTTEKEIAEAQPLKKSTKRALFQHTTNIEGDSIIKKPKHKGLIVISQHDYESEASGNDQDIHSINESQEEGEINDKKEQMGYEMNAPGKSVDSFEEGEIIGESDDGCVKDCMGKKLDDDVEKDSEDCSRHVTENVGGGKY